jgi:alpha-amylase
MINFIFGIHNHQPVGNFDGVFKQTYKDCYLPFVSILEKFPKVKACLHFTGPLLEWIEQNHPEYFDKLRKLLERKQIELMGGGFYEPLLPIIPQRDALGQLQMMQDYIKEKFGVVPKGMWLAERVWEPGLPTLISKAGLKYVTIDDTHFYYSGFKANDMFGYYVTEDQGHSVNVFPIDKELRYRVPFSLPEETIEYLRRLPDGKCVTLADDGEKFGVWPGTHKWVYEEGYLEKLFTLLSENSHWINMITFSEHMKQERARGKVYLPTASYDEMMEWSLPAESQSAFSSIVEQLKNENKYNFMRSYVRGGFWRNFLVKYPESNQMYSKMIHVSEKIHHAKNLTASQQEKALRNLYRAQCNCSYWHGLFGGLYLNYIRHANYSNLIEAENILDLSPYNDEKDYDSDGQDEIMFSNAEMNLYFSPASGGQLLELDYKPKNFNLSNVLTRRPESYHKKIHSKQNENSSGQPQSIHDVVNMKEENLKDILFYDWYKRNSLIDHLLDPTANLNNFSECSYGERGDFVNQPYSVETYDKNHVIFVREGNIYIGDKACPLTIKKEIKTEKKMQVNYELINTGDQPLDLWFGVEFNFTLLAGNAKDRHYSIPGKNITAQTMNIKSENNGVKVFEFADEYNKFKVRIDLSEEALLWRFPVETVSHSESGLERTYQGSCMMPSWKFQLDPKKRKQLDISLIINNI